MKFIQIKLEEKFHPDRFNRLIAVRPDLNLYEIGYVIGISINAIFEHCYLFEVDGKEYVEESWIDEILPIDGIKQYDMKKYNLNDLGDHFEYTYDTGENYIFNCYVLNETVDIDISKDMTLLARTIEGKGLGIFENNHACLDDYLDGLIKPNAKHGKKEYQELPFNLNMEKFSDFEKPLYLYEYDVREEDLEVFNNIWDPSEDEEFDDGKIDETVLETFIRESAALDIFEDIDINQKYRQLILKYDINDAYEMIVKCLIEAHKKADEEGLGDDELDKIYYEAVEDLD